MDHLSMDYHCGLMDDGFSSGDESGSPSPSQARKSNKPLLEKKRRARINRSLDQLKLLVLDALKKDSARYSKLEKADILEMTVKHLRDIQGHQMAAAMSVDPSVVARYRAGFSECAKEVERYLGSIDGLGTQVRMRLLQHLGACISPPVTSYPYPAAAGQYMASGFPVGMPTATPLGALPGQGISPVLPFGGLHLVQPRASSSSASPASLSMSPSPEPEMSPSQSRDSDVYGRKQSRCHPYESQGTGRHLANENVYHNRHLASKVKPLGERNENVSDANNNSRMFGRKMKQQQQQQPRPMNLPIQVKVEASENAHRDAQRAPPHGLLLQMVDVKDECVWRPW